MVSSRFEIRVVRYFVFGRVEGLRGFFRILVSLS